MSAATSTATTVQATVFSPQGVVYLGGDNEGYTFTVTPHPPTAR